MFIHSLSYIKKSTVRSLCYDDDDDRNETRLWLNMKMELSLSLLTTLTSIPDQRLGCMNYYKRPNTHHPRHDIEDERTNERRHEECFRKILPSMSKWLTSAIWCIQLLLWYTRPRPLKEEIRNWPRGILLSVARTRWWNYAFTLFIIKFYLWELQRHLCAYVVSVWWESETPTSQNCSSMW